MKTILVISFTNLATDPRVNRQIRWLADRYRVIAVGLADPLVEGVQFISCASLQKTTLLRAKRALSLAARQYESFYWSATYVQAAVEGLRDIAVDLVIANDLDSLPLALRAAKDSPVILDAHEYAPREFEDRWTWRLLMMPYKEYLCKRYINKAQAMMTVCQGIAEEYQRQFGVTPAVVTNAPDYQPLEPHATNSQKIRMIHHGGAIPSRRIENMIRMMDQLDERFELDFMLVASNPAYLDELKRLAAPNPRISFVKPVSMREIAQAISAYDIGLYLLEPNSFNNRMALPNKLFEFIQGRLAIAIGPSPEMARLVNSYQLGIVTDDFSPTSLAAALNKLDAETIDQFKKNVHESARILSAEANHQKFFDVIEKVLG